MSQDPLAELRGPGWQRLLAAARRRLERTGGIIEGSVGLAEPTDAERRVVIGITGAYRPEGVRRLGVELAVLDGALRAAYGMGLLPVSEHLGGPLRNRPAERDAEAGARAGLVAVLQAGRHAGQPWYEAWAEAVTADGTLTRLLRRGDAAIVSDSVHVLDLLPIADASTPLPLAAASEAATGDTKALTPGSPTSILVLRALAAWAGEDPPRNAAAARGLWERFGVVADDLASQVLVLNLPTRRDHTVGAWLAQAAEEGIPFRLTLHQLSLASLTVTAPIVHVCENPAVLRAAAAELGARSAPLVCTEGVPSTAFHRLVSSALASGVRLRVRADFDWAGLRIVSTLLRYTGSEPWRMTTSEYQEALSLGDTVALEGKPVPSPWDPALAQALAASSRAVMEERLLPSLLADLHP